MTPLVAPRRPASPADNRRGTSAPPPAHHGPPVQLTEAPEKNEQYRSPQVSDHLSNAIPIDVRAETNKAAQPKATANAIVMAAEKARALGASTQDHFVELPQYSDPKYAPQRQLAKEIIMAARRARCESS